MNAPNLQPRARGRFQGVAQVVRFNWPRYAVAVVVVVTIGLILPVWNLPSWILFGAITAASVSLWWTVASLVASYRVYDLSELMRWEWLKRELPEAPRHWLNVHAGLDESTASLRAFWPDANGETIDIFSASEMTERSIRRARSQTAGAVAVDYRTLPYADEQFDRVFILFAAHELREPVSRRKFFGEIRRVMTPSGDVVLVEHLRDTVNFLAYGPGFLHFHSRASWIRDMGVGRLAVAREFSITPFVRVFILRKTP